MAKLFNVALQVSVWVIAMVCAADSLGAFNGHITEDPTKILHKYLALDKKGVRLDAYSWEVVKPFVAWDEEPVWGHVVVISQFEVVDDVSQWEIPDDLAASIPVIFEVLGTMYWENATFVANPHREFYYFQVQAVQDRWQIQGPQLPPHVGRQRMIDYVRWAELQESDQAKTAHFARLRKQIENTAEKDESNE